MKGNELVIDRLTKNYGNKIAVDRFSAVFTPGVYGLLGSNGAGKTTLMRLICDILPPTSGEVRFNGEEIRSLGENYREILGYLPQKFGFYPNFTAEKFLYYMATLKGIDKNTAKKRIEELLETVSLTDVKKQKIKTFSGGMKQRLGIAQAMLSEPKILILDEPTAGLDPKERVKFRNLLSIFSKDRIVILSTHIVSDIEFIADDILIMKKGELILRGTVDELVSKIKDSVWEVNIPVNNLSGIESKYTVININTEGDFAVVRLLASEKPFENAKACTARLEDLYLYCFNESGVTENVEAHIK